MNRPWVQFPNFGNIALKYPHIAAAIRRVELTFTQLQRIACAIALAWEDNHYWIVERGTAFQVREGSLKEVDTTTLRGKNQLFYRKYKQQIDKTGLGDFIEGLEFDREYGSVQELGHP